MDLLEALKELGVNIEEAEERFMGNVALYRKMLGAFPNMLRKSTIPQRFESGSYTEITEKAHALKGATGNLSLIPLYEAYSEIVRLMRESKPEQAEAVYREMLPVQDEIVRCIEKYTVE